MSSDEPLFKILKEHFVIFVCEGRNEEEIIKWLLEEEKIVMDEEDDYTLKYIRALRTVSSKRKFGSDALQIAYEKPPAIVYVLDSKKEKLRLGKAYEHVPIFHVITTPEIEQLFIIQRGLEKEFNKFKSVTKKKKPSEFCKEKFKDINIKSADAVRYIFEEDVDNLLKAIKRYDSITKKREVSIV